MPFKVGDQVRVPPHPFFYSPERVGVIVVIDPYAPYKLNNLVLIEGEGENYIAAFTNEEIELI